MKKMKQTPNEKSSVSELKPWPSFIQERLTFWDKLKAEKDAEIANRPEKSISITLPDGKVVEGTAWRTTAYDIARGIRYFFSQNLKLFLLNVCNSQGLADNVVISKVNDVLWDLDRPLEDNCKLELLKFDNPEAQSVFWHSTAHILGEALERVYGGCLCYGPPIESGFYYDMFLDEKGVLCCKHRSFH
jgi:threonyl-tRNA synthetase